MSGNPGFSPGFSPGYYPPMGTVVTFTVNPNALAYVPGNPCPGCGLTYMTLASGVGPHNFEACAAFKRGYEMGLLEGRREASK